MLLLSGCAWRHKDFKEDLNRPVSIEPQVEVDAELMEKFKVEPEVIPEPEVKAVAKKLRKSL